MKVCTMGLGYIGLPTSVVFAKHGAEVVGVDIFPEIVDQLNNGNIHIEEPGLCDLTKEVVEKGAFRASLRPEAADVFIISVPTPNMEDGYKSCDLQHVLRAVRQITPYIGKGNVVIVESTIAPRSMDDYVKPMLEEAGFVIGEDLFLVHCPERVLPGKILHEIIYNNRIVGGVTPACMKAGAKVYGLFVKGEIIQTDAKTAEMSKLMENTFRDVNIALANELAKICHDLEVNVLDVVEMANKHPRVNLHHPGPGVGGHCLAVDPYFIAAKAPKTAKIIQLARETNVSMPEYVVRQTHTLVEGINHPKVAVFGAAYKGNVDDVRESPAMDVIQLLKKSGVQVAVHDPHVKSALFDFVSCEDAVKDAHLILVLTDHNEFKELDYDSLAQLMRTPLLFDTRHCIPAENSHSMKLYHFGNLHKRKEKSVAYV
ncbi:UDP-N-acetyl-D-mannosaminuronic acid dehydrogenase [Scopulibacillus darangshiensis]|uniref:UDP-N-acetyl-D-mannosaminuronic acid dehydrogenase n=1 Tax=Scopulibacillus darangshiensis TaxID=442528 RepID=A0A4R2P5E7_9BACL|nr:nucleotide sugar dehydrogenase [Scopulibacillus darangshiensis]TCP30003.1 UDP-N-acetyl-D-mannosaminuronic acid dehydrogenase [Scopulibacillus darangshiensis]